MYCSSVNVTMPSMRGETIVCVATRLWDSLWRDSQQIMSRMAVHNRVLYFEPGRDTDRSLSSEMWRSLPNFASLYVRHVHENLIVLPTPSCLPYARRHLPRFVLQATTPRIATVNARIMTRHIRRVMATFRVEAPILWLYEPRHIDLVGKFGEKLACYYNYDEHADFASNTRIKELLRQYDNRLSSCADIVFATSRGQWERRKHLNLNTYFIPNGVDFDLFHRALDPGTTLPENVAGLKRPIIGLAGWLAFQIDVDLLLLVAEAYPDCSLVLVGPDGLPDDARKQRLRARSNVYFLGQKDLASLPRYLKAFDVALIPYLVGGHTLTVYPLKLHEYLAAGRGIVATALPELQPFKYVARIAETHDEFIRQIGAALDDVTSEAIEARVAVARENTWDQRVTEIYRVLQHHLRAAKE